MSTGQSLLTRALRAKINEIWAQDPTFYKVIAHYDHLNHPVAEGFRSEKRFDLYVSERAIDLTDTNVLVDTAPPQAIAG